MTTRKAKIALEFTNKVLCCKTKETVDFVKIGLKFTVTLEIMMYV